MARHPSFADLVRMQRDMTLFMLNTQAVIGIRMLGLAGLWPVHGSENDRMVSEKPVAFARAAQAAWIATVTGKRPDQIAEAWIRPISLRAASNRRRLSRRR